MENLYVKLGWPEYQAYQQFNDFDEHAHYCPDDDVYFIEQSWLDKQIVGWEPDASISLEYNGVKIELSSRYVGMDLPSWEEKNGAIHHHKVTIKIGFLSHTFDYWSGVAHYRNTTVMSERDMIDAFDSFLMDCTYADQSIDDFQKELCYTNVSDCIRAYNGCKDELEAWKKFGLSPYEVENWLREKYDL